jgi:tetratricopeptide (TPR) repeat protein
MRLPSTLLPLLLVLVIQSPRDSFQKHYSSAEAHHRAGNVAAAEAEYKAVLGEAYHKLGRAYSELGNYREAINALEASISYRPDALDALIDLAIAYFYNGQYKQSIAPLNKTLALDPKNNSAHHMLGKTYFMLSDFKTATAELETALRSKLNDYDVAYTLGLSYLKQDRLSSAKQIYQKMITQLGNRPQLRVLIGRAYRETGFLAEAITEFKQAIALDPKFPRVHYYLGLTYLRKDGATRLPEATEEFKTELAAHPEEFLANQYLGIVYTIERKWNLAIPLLQKAATVQPNNPSPYFYLGQSYQALEKYDSAIEMLTKTIALNPDPARNDDLITNAHFRLGQSLLKVGHKEEAEKELRIAQELKSKKFKRDEAKLEAFINPEGSSENGLAELATPAGVIAQPRPLDAGLKEALQNDAAFYAKVVANAHNNIGLLRAEGKDFRVAAEQFGLAAKWDPQLQDVAYNLGLAYFKAERYKDAVLPLENELRMNPSNPTNLTAKHLLGLSYLALENYAKASELLSEVAIAKPNDVGIYYPLALALGREGKIDEMSQVIQRMLTVGGDSPQIHMLLGQAHYNRGDTVKAVEELKTALSLDPKVRLAHFHLGLIYLKTGKLEDATREFEAELALNPTDVQAKYHLGFTLLARQEAERGLRLMREVIQAKPDFGNAHFELGKALLQRGDIRNAVESLEQAAKLEPDQPHVHYQLGRAYIAAGRRADGDNELEISRKLKEKSRAQSPQ